MIQMETKINISLSERAKSYNNKFRNFSKQAPLVVTNRWLYGVWMIGNNYQSKQKYYGEYPPGYLNRIFSLFPDIKSNQSILHLFSGSLDKEIFGLKLDTNKDLSPDILGDAHKLSKLTDKKFKLIIADPPYSNEDAVHYGTPMINRNKVVSECYKVLEDGGFLVWLDQVLPMYRKEELKLVGTIGLIRSTNHRVRFVFIWKKGTKNNYIKSWL